MFVKYKLVEDVGGHIGKIPIVKTSEAACADLALPYDVVIYAHEHTTIDLLIIFDIPLDWCLYLQPRSSTFTKRGLLSTTGIIDSDYKGTVHAQLFNMLNESVLLREGDRLVQVQILPKQRLQLEAVDFIKPSDSRKPFIGSTGL